MAVSIVESKFEYNEAFDDGGALGLDLNQKGSLSVRLTLFQRNRANGKPGSSAGGACYIEQVKSLAFTDCTFRENYALWKGGALRFAPDDNFTAPVNVWNGLVFLSNEAGWNAGPGGGAISQGTEPRAAHLQQAMFCNNSDTFTGINDYACEANGIPLWGFNVSSIQLGSSFTSVTSSCAQHCEVEKISCGSFVSPPCTFIDTGGTLADGARVGLYALGPLTVITGNLALLAGVQQLINGNVIFDVGSTLVVPMGASLVVSGQVIIKPGSSLILHVNQSSTYLVVSAASLSGTFTSVMAVSQYDCQTAQAVQQTSASTLAIVVVVSGMCSGGLSQGALIGIIVACVLVGIGVAVAVVLVVRRSVTARTLEINRWLRKKAIDEAKEMNPR